MRHTHLASILGLVLVYGVGASAQTSGSQSSTASPSDTQDALPGVHRVGVPGVAGPRVSAAGSIAYGFTEPQNGEADPHHRLSANAALGVAPWSFAEAALRVDFRHDAHGSDDLGGDSGSSIDVTPLIRMGGPVHSGFHLGAEARLAFPGAAAESGIPPAVFDGRALASYLGMPTWTFASHLGYRAGVSDSIAQQASRLRPGDRVALGLSEYDALLLGLGAVKSIKRTDLFLETTYDIYLGNGAPSAGKAPLRISGGARYRLSHGFSLQGLLEVVPLGRAASTAADPLVPIEPRFSALLGVVYRLPRPDKESAPAPKPQAEAAAAPTDAKALPAPVVVVAPPASAPPTSALRVTVVDHNGHPISDATVVVLIAGENGQAPQQRVVPLESENLYVLENVPNGTVTLSIKADLLQDQQQEIKVGGEDAPEVAIEMDQDTAQGSQLRGLVRSYSGQGIPASVSIEPGDLSTKCDELGEFRIQLPPGLYKVTISADGYQTQKRELRVQEEGVTVLNADLQASSN